MADKKGQCMCGAVKFRARNVASDFGACYCDMCRRWTGSFFAGVPVASSDLEIENQDTIRVIDSSDWAERTFCGKCGSALWYRLDTTGAGDSVSIAVGLLDDISNMALKREFYTDKKPASLGVPTADSQMTEADINAWIAARKEED